MNLFFLGERLAVGSKKKDSNLDFTDGTALWNPQRIDSRKKQRATWTHYEVGTDLLI